MKNRQIQFELWKECGNRCDFCYQRHGRTLTGEQKVEILKRVGKTIESCEESQISLIGGEFFEGQMCADTYEEFLKLIKIVDGRIMDCADGQFWLNASLLGDLDGQLQGALDKLTDKRKVVLCTSYDTCGRFHSLEDLQRWKRNLTGISRDNPGMQFNVNVILTSFFIDEYLEGNQFLRDIEELVKCTLYFKQPYMGKTGGVAGFLPQRKRMMDFFRTFRKSESEEAWELLLRNDRRSEKLIQCETWGINHRDKINTVEYGDFSKPEIIQCGHSVDYACYSDSDCCCLCDKCAFD